MEWLEGMLAFAWRPALAVIPIALIVAAICRLIPHRPATRHGLWLTVLCWFVVSGFLPTLRMPASQAPGDERELATAAEVEIVTDDAVTDIEARDDDKADIPAPRLARGVLMEDDSKPRAARGIRTAESPDASMVAARDSVDAITRVSHPRTFESSTPRALPSRDAIEDLAVEKLSAPAQSGIPVFVYQGIEPQPSAPSEPASIPRRSRDFSPGSPVALTLPKAPAAAEIFAHPLVRPALSASEIASPDSLDGILPSSQLESERTSLMNNEVEWLALRDAGEHSRRIDQTTVAPPDATPEDRSTTSVESPLMSSRLNRVTAALFNLRDAAAQIPLLPVEIWLAGVALVAFTVSTRLAAGRRLMSKSWEAPANVMAVVNDVARQLNITAPATVMIDRDVSPMIWCGNKFRLVLPSRLWDELDDAGRRAVVCHELAHLRRRDHWVRRLELAVTAVFWWHPVLWYVRHRLDEEADLSCDAWVSYLLPQQRRAYAQALIQTREYVSQRAPSGLGIGLTSAHAKRIARRIHMIMTNQKQPGFPVMGMLLAASVMVAGWVSLPSEACPPEKKEKCVPAPEEPTPDPDGSLFGNNHGAPIPDSVFGLLSPDVDDESDDSADEEDRAAEMAELEEEMAKLAREMDELRAQMRPRMRAGRGAANAPRLRNPAALRAPRTPRAARHPHPAPHVQGVPAVPSVPRVQVFSGSAATPLPPTTPTAPRIAGFGGSSGNAKISKRYEMPQEKLEKFTKLMVLEDVPVLVRPLENAIEVQATEAEHAVVGAFIDMIRDGWEDKRYTLPEEKQSAMWDLMALGSVPIRVSGGSGGISVQATASQHAIFRAFCELIHPTADHDAAMNDVLRKRMGAGFPAMPELARLRFGQNLDELEGARELLKSATAQAQGKSRVLRDHQRQMRQQARELERQARQHERQAEELQRRGEQRQRELEAEMRRMEEEMRKAEEAHQEAGDAQDEDGLAAKTEAIHEKHRAELDAHAADVEAKMREVEHQLHQFNVQAEALMRAAESIEHNADSVEGRSEQIRNRVEQLREVLQNLDRISAESKAFQEAWEVVEAVGGNAAVLSPVLAGYFSSPGPDATMYQAALDWNSHAKIAELQAKYAKDLRADTNWNQFVLPKVPFWTSPEPDAEPSEDSVSETVSTTAD
ncbi:MAG: M56 family metallopeptidase [Phycisphaerae bacterium]